MTTAKNQRRVLQCALLFFVLVSGVSTYAEPRVKTTEGWVEGLVANDIAQFLGIPYAQPPVGELRWQPPRPANKRDKVLTAHAFGHAVFSGLPAITHRW